MVSTVDEAGREKVDPSLIPVLPQANRETCLCGYIYVLLVEHRSNPNHYGEGAVQRTGILLPWSLLFGRFKQFGRTKLSAEK